MRIDKEAARAEALEIAIAFLTAGLSGDGRWRCEYGPATPWPGPGGRKTFLKWTEAVRWIPVEGGVFDRAPCGVIVDLVSKQGPFAETSIE